MSELFGIPYVGWSPRPLKNGQPPACKGQCNQGIAARKVGAAMKRLPNIQLGHKVKEEILQKWDPASRSMVTIHKYKPAIVTNATLTLTNIESGTVTISWDLSIANATTSENVNVQLFQSSVAGIGTGALFSQFDNVSVRTLTLNSLISGYYYHAKITPISGVSVFSRVMYLKLSPHITSWGNVSIVHPYLKVYPGFATGAAGAQSPTILGNNIYFVGRADIEATLYSIIVRVPIDGSNSSIIYSVPVSTAEINSITSYNGDLYFSSANLNNVQKGVLSPSGDTLTVSNYTPPGSLTSNPREVAFDSLGNMYIGRYFASKIAKVSPNGVDVQTDWATVSNAQGTQAQCAFVGGIEYLFHPQTLYNYTPPIADVIRIRLSDPTDQQLVAGGLRGFSGENIPPIGQTLSAPRSVVVDPYGNVYISNDFRYSFIDSKTGLIRTILGTGNANESGTQGVPGTSVDIGGTRGCVIDTIQQRGYFLTIDGVMRSMPYTISNPQYSAIYY